MEAPKMENVIHKPWGYERIISKTDRYVVKEIYVKSGCRLSKQYHEKKTETMFLVSGCAILLRESVKYKMKELVPYLIAPLMVHRLEAPPTSDALIVEISSTELEDVVRMEDDYGRKECEPERNCHESIEVCEEHDRRPKEDS